MKDDARVGILIDVDSSKARIVATDPDDDCTITDSIDIGRDGTPRRITILRELAAREDFGLVHRRTGRRIA